MLWKHRVSLEKIPFLSRGLPTVTRGQSKTVLFRYLQCGMERAFKMGEQGMGPQVFFSGEHAAEYLLISRKSKKTLATPWSLAELTFLHRMFCMYRTPSSLEGSMYAIGPKPILNSCNVTGKTVLWFQ